MYYLQSEHNPPHIHAIYNDDVALIEIANGNVLDGNLPPKALKMVQEWTHLNQEALQDVWDTQIFRMIPPLE